MTIPIAIAAQFHDLGETLAEKTVGLDQWFVWLSVPFSIAVMWVFHTMNRIGRVGENPFEGSANDVPISTIARGIEIDLRQNLGEDPESIPNQFEERSYVQM